MWAPYSHGRSSGGHGEAVRTHLGREGGRSDGGTDERRCLPGRKCGPFPATAPSGQALLPARRWQAQSPRAPAALLRLAGPPLLPRAPHNTIFREGEAPALGLGLSTPSLPGAQPGRVLPPHVPGDGSSGTRAPCAQPEPPLRCPHPRPGRAPASLPAYLRRRGGLSVPGHPHWASPSSPVPTGPGTQRPGASPDHLCVLEEVRELGQGVRPAAVGPG